MTTFREISGDDAAQLLEDREHPSAESVDFLRDEYANEAGEWVVRLYEGPTVFDGDFVVESDTVVVDGDLTVRGLLSDCGVADSTLLVVLGNLTVENAHLGGELIVRGNLRAEGLVYANSSNDYQLTVGGNLKARALVEGGTYCEILGQIEAKQVLSLQNEIVCSPARQRFVERRAVQASTVFRPEFLDGDYPDRDALHAAMKAGKQVLL